MKLSKLLLLALCAFPAAAPAQTGLGSLDIELAFDADSSGGPSCGDEILVRAALEPADPGTELQGAAFDLIPPTGATLLAGSVRAINPNGLPEVFEGNSPGDSRVDVHLGTVCGEDLCPHAGTRLAFRLRIDRPGTGVGRLDLAGTFSGDDFPSTPVTASVTFPACPGPPPPDPEVLIAQLSDQIAIDIDGDGRADPGDVVRYTARVLSFAEGFSNVGFTCPAGPEATLLPGSVTTTEGTIVRGNSPGDTFVQIQIGNLAADNEPVLVTFDVKVQPNLVRLAPLSVQGLVTTLSQVQVTDDPATGPIRDATLTPTDIRQDLTLTKSDGEATVTPNGVVVYELAYDNLGTARAESTLLRETLPEYTTFEPAASSPGWTCQGADCRLALGRVEPGQRGTRSFAVRVDPTLPAGVPEIFNAAVISEDGTAGPDAVPGNNIALDTTPLTGLVVDLGLTKDDGGTTVRPGEVVTYQLTYRNDGNVEATGLMLTDTIPKYSTFVPEKSSPGWLCTGATCTLALPDLPAGQAGTAAIAFRADTILPAGTTALVNLATIADDGANGPDGNPTDNLASDSTPLTGLVVDLRLTKDDGGASAAPGSTVVYTLTFDNQGNIGASGVELRDEIPAHTSFNPAASSAGWSCKTGVCIYPVGEVAVGSLQKLRIGFDVAETIPSGVDHLENRAQIGDDGAAGPDTNPADNQALDQTPLIALTTEVIATKADTLTLDLDADGLADPEDEITYRVLIDNVGPPGGTPAQARDLRYAVRAPLYTTLVEGSVTSSHGQIEPGPEGPEITIAVLDPRESAEITFTVRGEGWPEDTGAISCQGLVTGGNFRGTLTDDPETAAPADPTLTPVDDQVVPAPEPAEIPTLGALGMVAFALLITVAAVTCRRSTQSG